MRPSALCHWRCCPCRWQNMADWTCLQGARGGLLLSTQAQRLSFTASHTETETHTICPHGLIHPDNLGLFCPHPASGNIVPTFNAAVPGCLHPSLPLAMPTHPLQVLGAPQRPSSPFVPEEQPVSPLLAAKSILMFPCLNKKKLRLLHCRKKAPWISEEDIPVPALLPMNPFITSTSRPFTTAHNRENHRFGCQPQIF